VGRYFSTQGILSFLVDADICFYYENVFIFLFVNMFIDKRVPGKKLTRVLRVILALKTNNVYTYHIERRRIPGAHLGPYVFGKNNTYYRDL
jgi:hypothetical protein